MNAGELVERTRRDLRDVQRPYLVSDEEMFDFADEAQREAAERANLLVDASSPFCTIAIAAGVHTYRLDPRVLRVRRVMLDGRDRPLKQETTAALDTQFAGWQTMTGEPVLYLTDWESGKIRVVPTPDEAGTLRLRVVRLPLDKISSTNDELEIAPQYHADLRFWMLKRAYESPDPDLRNLDAAGQHEARFAQAFGEKLDARTKEFNARNLPADGHDGSE